MYIVGLVTEEKGKVTKVYNINRCRKSGLGDLKWIDLKLKVM